MIERIILLIEDSKRKGKYWIIRIIFWFIIFLFVYFIFSVNVLKLPYSYPFMIEVLVLTLISYYIIVLAFNKSFVRGLFSIIYVIVGYQYFTYYTFLYLSQFETASFFINAINTVGKPQFYKIPFNRRMFYFTYTMSLFHLAPPLGLKLIYELLRNFYQTQKLKEENLKLEMSYLRAQINPHFLLNTLTAIYNMVMDNPKAARSIETLSGLLQYSLYDTGSPKVALEKEVRFISNYIKLSRIRLNTNKKLKFTVTGSIPEDQMIAPLILVNVIENCIKHGLHRVSGAATAEIALTLENNILYLTTHNRLPETTSAPERGIGLENTCRRLEICYSGRYELNINDNNGFFHLNLRIEL